MIKTSEKGQRLVARVDSHTQRLIAHAAELSGVTLSQFLIDAAREKADKVSDRMMRIEVSMETADRILESLDGSARPTARLSQAARRYRNVIREPDYSEHQ